MTVQEQINVQLPVEQKIAWILGQKWNAFVKPNPPGKDSAKDFIMLIPRMGETLVEVKDDLSALRTDNVFLETWNCFRDQPSGLSATRALIWVHYVPCRKLGLLFHPRKMLWWLDVLQSDYPYLTHCGDGNACGYAVPIARVERLLWVTRMPMVL